MINYIHRPYILSKIKILTFVKINKLVRDFYFFFLFVAIIFLSKTCEGENSTSRSNYRLGVLTRDVHRVGRGRESL